MIAEYKNQTGGYYKKTNYDIYSFRLYYRLTKDNSRAPTYYRSNKMPRDDTRHLTELTSNAVTEGAVERVHPFMVAAEHQANPLLIKNGTNNMKSQ